MELEFPAVVSNGTSTEPEVIWWYFCIGGEVERKEFITVGYLMKRVIFRAHTLECTEKAWVSGTCILALMWYSFMGTGIQKAKLASNDSQMHFLTTSYTQFKLTISHKRAYTCSSKDRYSLIVLNQLFSGSCILPQLTQVMMQFSTLVVIFMRMVDCNYSS